jgi:hypothetical protein
VVYRNRARDILRKKDTLKFDEKEIQQLLHILEHSFKRLFRDGIVFTGAERACKTLREYEPSGNFGGGGYYTISERLRIEACRVIHPSNT